MSREILFRGKRIDNGECVYGTPIYPKGYDKVIITTGELAVPNMPDFGFVQYEVIPETVGLWTGLTDKNGMKMFEHDKLKDNKGQVGTIFYSETAAAFLVNWKMKDGSFETDACFYGEVIGTIFDKEGV